MTEDDYKRQAQLKRRVARGYSREFTPHTERRVTLTIDRIPPTMLDAAKAKAKRDGISLRALILGWLKEWTQG